MMPVSAKRAFAATSSFKVLAAVLLLSSGYAVEARSQSLDFAPKPAISAYDDVHANLKSGKLEKTYTSSISIGGAASPAFSYGLYETGLLGAGTPFYSVVTPSCATYGGVSGCIYYALQYNLGGEAEFYMMTPPNPNIPSSYTEQGSKVNPSSRTLTRKDGSIWTFTGSGGSTGTYPSYASSVTYPTGETLTWYYSTWGASIVSNRGYMMRLEGYVFPVNSSTPNGPTRVQLINLNTDYCSPTAAACTGLTVNWPSVVYTSTTATDTIGRVTTRIGTTTNTGTNTWDVVTRVTSPEGVWIEEKLNATGPYGAMTICDPRSTLAYVKTDAGQWNYTWTGTGSCKWAGVTGGVSTGPDAVVQKWDAGYVDGLGRKTTYTMNGYSNFFQSSEVNVASVTLPEGNKYNFSYDDRKNMNQTVATNKAANATISASASFPVISNCSSSPNTCNKPDYTIDANGQRTDYTYSTVHGQVLTKTLPADSSGVRPQIRYTYTQLSARYQSAAGVYAYGTPIWMLTSTSECRTGASCAGTDDETITAFTYNDNLLPVTTTIKTGTGTVLKATATGYDSVGNVVFVDGPRTDLDDKTYYFYDGARQKVGEISPDPDGSGPLPRLATRTTYDLDGRVTRVESGTATGAARTDLDNMAVSSYIDTAYDTLGRATKTTVVSGGVAQTVTQYNYDIRGKLVCTAVRMNPAVFGSLPTDACAPGTAGAYGPDRITKNIYDNAGELQQVIQAYGTADQRAYATYAYSQNGKTLDTVDANGNRSTLQYDGFDRPSTLFYPSATRPAAFNPSTPATALATAGSANGSDYEVYSYDNNGNRTGWRRRDGQTFYYTFDNLNRQIRKDVPGTSTGDVYSGYDLQGNVLYNRFGSATGAGTQYWYDGLGQMTSSTDMNGRSIWKSYRYTDGIATALLWPDGLGLNTDDRDALNRVKTAYFGNGGLVVYTGSYDSLGRLATVGRQGGGTSLGYDNLGRVTSMTNDLNGTAYDINWGFGYNPAGQIYNISSGSTTYDYKETVNSSDGPAYDGLNRDTRLVGATATCPSGGYDARQNLICDSLQSPNRTFSYDVENRMLTGVSATANVQMVYDPEGRLSKYSTDGGSTWSSYLYDGTKLIAAYDNSGAITARYIHGDGVDKPLVWVVGSGTGNMRPLYTNYQGSVIADTDSSGNLLDLYKYGPYGEPKDIGNNEFWGGSPFRYTGQMALPGLQLYYYKARVYDPKWGRFLQTDPIGSKDDLNLYAYTGDDPVNRSDPTGLASAETRQCDINPQSCSTPSVDSRNKSPLRITDSRRQADGSYIAPTGPGSPIGDIKAAGGKASSVIGDAQCVTACKYFSGITARTPNWRFGAAAANNATLPIGTAIATMDPETKRYPVGDHAEKNSGIYMGPGSTPGSIKILDQWGAHPEIRGPDGLPHPPAIRELPYNSRNGLSNSASAYRVIVVPVP